MRSLQLEKINNFFAADSTGKIHVKNDIKIPPRIASFWIQLIARDGLHHPADESIFPIAKTIGRDGWLIHFNRSNQLMGTSFFTMEGQVINCGLHRVSIDRANN
jgi:hypothetical protein